MKRGGFLIFCAGACASPVQISIAPPPDVNARTEILTVTTRGGAIAAFAHDVGAGPLRVASDVPSDEVVHLEARLFIETLAELVLEEGTFTISDSGDEGASEFPRASSAFAMEVSVSGASSWMPLDVGELPPIFYRGIPRPPAPRLIVSSLELDDGANYTPNSARPPPSARRLGKVRDFAVLQDRVVVAIPSETVSTYCLVADRSTRFDFYGDTEALAPIGTATTSGCFEVLAPDPLGAGFLAAGSVGRVPSIARFDAGGRLLSIVPADQRSGMPPANEPQLLSSECDAPIALIALDSAIVLAFAIATDFVCSDDSSALFSYDPSTLELESVLKVPGRQLNAVVRAVDDARRLVLGDGFEPAIRVATVDELVGELVLPPDSNQVLFDVAPLEDGRVLVAIDGPTSGVELVRGDAIGPRAPIIPKGPVPIGALRWPEEGRERVLVAGTHRVLEDWPAVMSLYDPAEGKFLGDPLPIGYGAAGRMREDEEGRAWILLPWDARLVRVEYSK